MTKNLGRIGMAVLFGAISVLTEVGPGVAGSALNALDPDRDGTVDINEAKTAASALFDRLDRDRDGTLDARELRGRLKRKEVAAADPDRDGTLTKAEYLVVIEQRFAAANPDNDGTIDDKELRSKPGKALLRLLK